MEIHRDIPSSNIPSNFTETNKQTKSEGTLAENAVKDINKQPSVSQTAHNVSHSVDYRGETPSKTIVQMVQSVKQNLEGGINRLVGQSKLVEQRLMKTVNKLAPGTYKLDSKPKTNEYNLIKNSEYYKSYSKTNLNEVKDYSSNASEEKSELSIQNEDYLDDEILDHINDEDSEESQRDEPQVEVSVGYAKWPNYGSEAEKKDKKVQTIYQSLSLTNDGTDDIMTIVKERTYQSGKTEEITKRYKFKEVAGKGTTGEAQRYESIDSPDTKTKNKVVKVAFDADGKLQIEKGFKILEKQHFHPVKNVSLNSIPGIVKKNKYLGENFSLQADYDGGDLRNVCGNLSAHDYIDVMGQLLFGLKHLHTDTEFKPGILHRDIKPGNILYRNKQYGLADLDGAHGLEETHAKDVMTTHGYLSPQDLSIATSVYHSWTPEEQRKFNVAHDIYAMGMTFRELLTGEKGFYPNGNRIPNFNFKYEDIKFKPGGEPSPAEAEQLKKMIDLINDMTDTDWQFRPGSAQECFDLYASIDGITVPDYS